MGQTSKGGRMCPPPLHQNKTNASSSLPNTCVHTIANMHTNTYMYTCTHMHTGMWTSPGGTTPTDSSCVVSPPGSTSLSPVEGGGGLRQRPDNTRWRWPPSSRLLLREGWLVTEKLPTWGEGVWGCYRINGWYQLQVSLSVYIQCTVYILYISDLLNFSFSVKPTENWLYVWHT